MFDALFLAWGYPVTPIESLAFLLALACVGFEVLERHWAWPLAIVSSALYGCLFFEFRLYGDAALQLLFIALACWGWWQWLYGHRVAGVDATAGQLRIARLGLRGCLAATLGWALGWVLLGLWLRRFTDTDVPWFDAFPTAGSVLGQLLMARKFLESWYVWMLVNTVATGLFAYKALWLTALLYAIFALLSVLGWRRWRVSIGMH